MTPEQKAAIRDRYWAWYHNDCGCEMGAADWSDRDVGESDSDCIVRNDVPDLLAALDEAEAERDLRSIWRPEETP